MVDQYHGAQVAYWTINQQPKCVMLRLIYLLDYMFSLCYLLVDLYRHQRLNTHLIGTVALSVLITFSPLARGDLLIA